jgi:hypothetical protein
VIDDFVDPEWLERVRREAATIHRSKRKVRLRVDRLVKTLIQDLTPPIFRKTIKALKRRARGDKTIEV